MPLRTLSIISSLCYIAIITYGLLFVGVVDKSELIGMHHAISAEEQGRAVLHDGLGNVRITISDNWGMISGNVNSITQLAIILLVSFCSAGICIVNSACRDAKDMELSVKSSCYFLVFVLLLMAVSLASVMVFNWTILAELATEYLNGRGFPSIWISLIFALVPIPLISTYALLWLLHKEGKKSCDLIIYLKVFILKSLQFIAAITLLSIVSMNLITFTVVSAAIAWVLLHFSRQSRNMKEPIMMLAIAFFCACAFASSNGLYCLRKDIEKPMFYGVSKECKS